MHPREFGKYRIVKLLPLGGMGRVYLALDTQLNRQVALKLIEQGNDPERREIVEAERRGAILQSRLCGLDRRVTVIRSYGDLDDFFFIEMEYVEGEDLAEVLRRGPLGIPFAARIGSDICDVLHHAHTFTAEIEGHSYHGIVHGDIKPRNIRIKPDGQVKVLDFGIAKALSLSRKFTTNQFGSSQYSSPERLNTGEVDVASDLWSVGVVLYEIVTGTPYFEAESGPKIEHIIRNYRKPRDLPSTLPERFKAILRRALHPEPALRYGSAAEFSADLKAFLENRETAAEGMPDDEATRRLGSAADAEVTRPARAAVLEPDDAVTRRTSPAASPIPAKPARTYKPLTRTQKRVRFFVAAGVAMVVIFLLVNEVNAYRGGAALKHDLETEKLTDLNVAWQRYDALARSSVLPVLLSGPRNAIRARLIAGADRVLAEYRDSNSPTVTESDWVRAQAAYARALQFDTGDKQIRGKMYVCEGHIQRIRGAARNQSKLYAESKARFEEARELIPKSPDPYLGLARLYVYALSDVERAEEALRAADKRGHELGRREKSQIADGYKNRGERLMREVARAADRAEEKDYLERAKQDYQRAEELYREVVPFGAAAANLRKIREQLDFIEARLEIIRSEGD